MCSSQKASEVFSKLLFGWKIVYVDSIGNSWGLLAAWDPKVVDFNPFSTCASILLTGRLRGFKHVVNIVNYYGPCRDIEAFWKAVEAKGILTKTNPIFVGDLNLTTKASEIWGSTRCYPMDSFFRELFHRVNLIDILPLKIVLTWKNDEMGDAQISKRLDRFLVAEEFSELFFKVECGCSDLEKWQDGGGTHQ